MSRSGHEAHLRLPALVYKLRIITSTARAQACPCLLTGPPSPSEAQSTVARKGIRKLAYRSNKVLKAASSGSGRGCVRSPAFLKTDSASESSLRRAGRGHDRLCERGGS